MYQSMLYHLTNTKLDGAEADSAYLFHAAVIKMRIYAGKK